VKKGLAFSLFIAIVKSQALLVYVNQLDGSRYIVGLANFFTKKKDIHVTSIFSKK
jgi:hypothetical protein